MVLTIDIGNSNIVATLFDNQGLILNQNRQKTIKDDCDSQYQRYAQQLKNEFDINHVEYIVSCVVPAITEATKRIFKSEFGCDGHWLNHQSYPGISKLLNPPEEVGADLIASSVEAIEKYQQPAIIVDMGTANKVIVIDDNTIQGVIIAPGVGLLRDSITKSIPHLPSVPLEFPEKIIGQTTMDSIQSGIMTFTKNSIVGVVHDISEELENNVTTILTGGYSRFFKDQLKNYIYDEDIVSKGLFTLSKRNCDGQ